MVVVDLPLAAEACPAPSAAADVQANGCFGARPEDQADEKTEESPCELQAEYVAEPIDTQEPTFNVVEAAFADE